MAHVSVLGSYRSDCILHLGVMLSRIISAFRFAPTGAEVVSRFSSVSSPQVKGSIEAFHPKLSIMVSLVLDLRVALSFILVSGLPRVLSSNYMELWGLINVMAGLTLQLEYCDVYCRRYQTIGHKVVKKTQKNADYTISP